MSAGEFTRVMTWLPNSQELVFAAGSVIVVMQSKFWADPQQSLASVPWLHTTVKWLVSIAWALMWSCSYAVICLHFTVLQLGSVASGERLPVCAPLSCSGVCAA